MACVRRRRGKWVIDFRDRDGTRRWETFATRKAADTALSERVKQLGRGSYRPPAQLPTFQDVAADWLASKADRRVSTLAQWQVHLDLHLVPAVGHLRLDQITVQKATDFRGARLAAGLGPRTVNKLLTTGAAVYKYANQQDLTDRNPFALAERCRRDAAEVQLGAEDAQRETGTVGPEDVLSPAEAGQLLAAARPGFYGTFFLTAVLTGARVGELTALTWDDVDLEGATVTIERTVSWAKPRGTKDRATPRFYRPKTESSRRTIPLSAELVSALRRWKLACPPSPLDLVFPSTDGRPRHRSTITHDGLRPALKAAGLRRVTIHSLRHSFASGLIMQGRPVTEVAHLLGHASPAVTLNVYSHWFKDTKTDAVAGWAKMICGTGTAASGSAR